MIQLLSAVLAAAILAPSAVGDSTAAAQARTHALVETFQQLHKGEAAANRKVYAKLDDFFDYEKLTSVPIAGIEDRFSASQKQQFARKFRDLIRGLSFGDSGDFFRKAELKFSEPREDGDRAVVAIDARDPSKDIETRIEFSWAKDGDTLRIVDASFDGTSLIKDYQNQFARIVTKEGVGGLLKRMDERRAEAEKKGSFAK